MNRPREISVRQLQTGMTVWKYANGKFTRICELAEYFPTSLRRPTITFEVKSGGPVASWHPCGTVWITQ